MTELELFELLRPIILSVTGVPECILADPNKPAPTGSYAAVRPKQNIVERGQAIVKRSSQAGVTSVDEEIRAQVIAECSVNFYRDGAIDYAERLKQANRRPNVAQSLFQANVGWQRTGPINNLTALQSNRYEQRAQISIFLMYVVDGIETVNSIERLTTQYENEAGQVLQTISVQTDDAP